uniref:Uncharacterized protein n=1 Tax=viral metagenome TaxID=1070528 RepID=A0A6C0IQT9_9ZZZZ
MELTSYQLTNCLRRFPEFELSYETIQHKKVCNDYELCMAIPSGKKFYIWHTFHKNLDVCYLLELNKQKEIVKGTCITNSGKQSFSLGTVLYGTVLDDRNVFIIEDIYYYQGILLKYLSDLEKMYVIKELLELNKQVRYNKKQFQFYIPNRWKNDREEITNKINKDISEQVHYDIHHVQYRSIHKKLPYINVPINQKINANAVTDKIENTIIYKKYSFDFKKPQYNYPTVFLVYADIQYDIYHLYAYGRNGSNVYYNIAYIHNYKKSVFMNSLFRNIRENKNLDYIEESEDEEEFENIAHDKFVNLKKAVPIECSFHKKFKKWIPVRISNNGAKIVHINKLVSDYYDK